MDPIKYVVVVVKEPVVRAPSGENAEWWKSRVVSAPNGESAGGESAVVRTPMVKCPVTKNFMKKKGKSAERGIGEQWNSDVTRVICGTVARESPLFEMAIACFAFRVLKKRNIFFFLWNLPPCLDKRCIKWNGKRNWKWLGDFWMELNATFSAN